MPGQWSGVGGVVEGEGHDGEEGGDDLDGVDGEDDGDGEEGGGGEDGGDGLDGGDEGLKGVAEALRVVTVGGGPMSLLTQ
jgi:hypothetical protein